MSGYPEIIHDSMILLLLCYVVADKPLVPGVARLYLADRVKHDEVAAEWTLRFAR